MLIFLLSYDTSKISANIWWKSATSHWKTVNCSCSSCETEASSLGQKWNMKLMFRGAANRLVFRSIAIGFNRKSYRLPKRKKISILSKSILKIIICEINNKRNLFCFDLLFALYVWMDTKEVKKTALFNQKQKWAPDQWGWPDIRPT